MILLLACLATEIALGEPSLAKENAAENAAIKKEWESWNAPFKPFRPIANQCVIAQHQLVPHHHGGGQGIGC